MAVLITARCRRMRQLERSVLLHDNSNVRSQYNGGGKCSRSYCRDYNTRSGLSISTPECEVRGVHHLTVQWFDCNGSFDFLVLVGRVSGE